MDCEGLSERASISEQTIVRKRCAFLFIIEGGKVFHFGFKSLITGCSGSGNSISISIVGSGGSEASSATRRGGGDDGTSLESTVNRSLSLRHSDRDNCMSVLVPDVDCFVL